MYFAHINEFTKCNPTRVAPMSDIVVIKIKTQVLNDNAKEKTKKAPKICIEVTYQVYYQISMSTLHKDFKVEIHDQQ
jgi:hypothetical protein